MNLLNIANSIIFSLLFLVWNSKDWPNIFVKVILFGLAGSNIFYALHQMGYIVKM